MKLLADIVAGIGEQSGPQEPTQQVIDKERVVVHLGNPGNNRGESTHNRNKPGEHDGLGAVLFEESFRLNEILLLKQFRIRALKQLPTHAGAKAVAHVIAQNRGNKQE